MKACPEKGWGGPTDSPLLPQSASEPAEDKPAQKCLRPENSLPRLLPAAEKQNHQEYIKCSLPSHHLAPARPGACLGMREAYSLFILCGVTPIACPTVSFLVHSLALNNSRGERDCCLHT